MEEKSTIIVERTQLDRLKIKGRDVDYEISVKSLLSSRTVLSLYIDKKYDFVNLFEYEVTAASKLLSRDKVGHHDTLENYLLQSSNTMIGWLNGRKVELIHPIKDNGDIAIVWDLVYNEVEWIVYLEDEFGLVDIQTSNNYATKYKLLSSERYKQMRKIKEQYTK